MKPTKVGLNLVSERVGLGQGKKKPDDTCMDTKERRQGGTRKNKEKKKDENDEGALWSGYPPVH